VTTRAMALETCPTIFSPIIALVATLAVALNERVSNVG